MSFNINLPFQIPNLPSTQKQDHFEEQVRIFNAIRSLATEMANFYSAVPPVNEDSLSHGTIYVRCAAAVSAYRAVCLRADPVTGETTVEPARNDARTGSNGIWTRYLASGISLEAGSIGSYIGVALFGKVENVPCGSLGWTGGHTLYHGQNTTGVLGSAYSHQTPSDSSIVGLVLNSSSIFVTISAPTKLVTYNHY